MRNTDINKQSRQYIENQFGALVTFARERVEALRDETDPNNISEDNWYLLTEGGVVVSEDTDEPICDVNVWLDEDDDIWKVVVHPIRYEEDGYREVDYGNMVRLFTEGQPVFEKAVWI